MVTENQPDPVDCACVIHGNVYTWDYVDRLYSMLTRHSKRPINLHVYTELDRPVPQPYIKHSLVDWGLSGPKKAWWYKTQIFNTQHFRGPLLYFDLDVVIVKSIDWVFNLPLDYFWAVHDFKHLWTPSSRTLNSSMMYFHTGQYEHLWKNASKNLKQIVKQYKGDQDYLTAELTDHTMRFFDVNRVKSWRWQCLDGGYEFTKKRHKKPNTGTELTDMLSVMIFHGNPKPSQVQDPVIIHHWQ